MTFVRTLLAASIVVGWAGFAQAGQTIVFGADNLPPKSWWDEGFACGYAIDAATEALTRAGFEPVVKLEPWPRAIEDTRAGKGIITHFSKTPERERVFEFSEPLVFDRIVVVVRKGHEFPFASVKDLIGKRVGVLRGVAYGGEWAASLKNLTLEEDTDAVARIGKLVRDRLDAAIISSGAAGLDIALRKAGLDKSQFTILPTPILEDPNYLAMLKSPDSARTMAAIDGAIDGMRADGTIDRIMAKYGEQN